MKISIITATYNAAETLSQCMDSVLSQTHSSIEYIIIDGASTDGSLKLIETKANQDHQIKWISEPDRGIYDALNKGLAMATGDIIGFLHADDILASSETLENIQSVFNTKNCDGVYGDLHYVNKYNTDKIIRNWTSQTFYPHLLQQGWMPPHPTLFLKNSVYKNNGDFDTSYKIASDYDFILRVFKQPHLNFQYLPNTIVKMRVGGASNRNLKNISKKMQEDLKALRHNQIGGLPTLIKKNLFKLPQFFKK